MVGDFFMDNKMTQARMITPLFEDLAKVEHHHQLACQSCALYRLCLPLGLHRDDLSKLDEIIKRSAGFKRHQILFEPSSTFKTIFVVRSGSFKTTISAADGREQVTSFYFPGEFIGMDAIYQQRYLSTARALEASSVCELPYERLQEFSATIPELQNQLMARLSKELSSDKNLLLSLGKKTAQEKLISFLLSLSQRFSERGYSSMSFQLTMSRGDIANHLGLAIETVSRLFTQLQEQQLLTTQGKEVTILDLPTLKQRCG